MLTPPPLASLHLDHAHPTPAQLGIAPTETDEEKTLRECGELQTLYESQMRDLLAWVAATTEALNTNAFDANDSEQVERVRAELAAYEVEKAVRADRKAALLGNVASINETLAAKNLPLYTPPEDVSEAVVEAQWAALLEAEAARRRALELVQQLAPYNAGADALNTWLDATVAAHQQRDFPYTSQELQALIAQHEQEYVAVTKAGKLEELAGLEATLGALVAAEAVLGMTPSQPTEPRTVEALRARFGALDEVDAARLAALQEALAAAQRRDAYEAAAGAHVQWLEATIGAYDSRDFPQDMAAVDALLAQLEEEQGAATEARLAERAALAEQLAGLQAEMEFVPSRGRSTHEIDAKWSQLDEATANRRKALAMHRQQLADAAWAQHFRDNEELIVQLQANIRGLLQRRADAERRKLWSENEDHIVKIQSLARGAAVRRKQKAMMDYYKANEDKIIKVQALWRGKLARSQYLRLVRSQAPPVGTVQKFLHLLDDSDKDFEEELELERLKQQAIYNIRDNAERERDVNALDIKIALLIKNRASLEEVVESTKKHLRKLERQQVADPGNLKSLDKESRGKLESYGHLFYLLQTEPHYLARLLYLLKAKDKAQKFIESVVLTLYGYAQNSREEYLLLKLIKAAIAIEMEDVTDLEDIVRGNPIFVRLVVHLSRGAKERQFLQDLLQPLVLEILEAGEGADMEVDPLAIYRAMIRDEEVKTGQKSTLPWDANVVEVLQHEAVRTALTERLRQVRTVTDKFLQAVIASLPKMPYPIRYIAQQMFTELKAKFPSESESAILRLVGHLIYYRYINPAVVAPEAFDVIDTLIGVDQRKNLAEISKMLQQVANGKQFDDDYLHLSPLNEYIVQAHGQFENFFRAATEVPSAEDHYQIDPLDDLAQKQNPVIYITTNELFTTHALLEEVLDDVVRFAGAAINGAFEAASHDADGHAWAAHRGAGARARPPMRRTSCAWCCRRWVRRRSRPRRRPRAATRSRSRSPTSLSTWTVRRGGRPRRWRWDGTRRALTAAAAGGRAGERVGVCVRVWGGGGMARHGRHQPHPVCADQARVPQRAAGAARQEPPGHPGEVRQPCVNLCVGRYVAPRLTRLGVAHTLHDGHVPSPVTNEHLKIYELQREREQQIQKERANKSEGQAIPRSQTDLDLATYAGVAAMLLGEGGGGRVLKQRRPSQAP